VLILAMVKSIYPTGYTE